MSKRRASEKERSQDASSPLKRRRSETVIANEPQEDERQIEKEEEEVRSLILKEKSTKKKKATAVKSKGEKEESTVIYLGHIPFGFFEKQMRGFFSQFGTIKRVRLSRSPTSGKSRGYAFIEFELAEVAKIVAETMHKYIMLGRILQCQVVPKEKVHPDVWKGKKKAIPTRLLNMRTVNRIRTPEQHTEVIKNLVSREEKKREQLQKKAIDYSFPGYSSAQQKKLLTN